MALIERSAIFVSPELNLPNFIRINLGLLHAFYKQSIKQGGANDCFWPAAAVPGGFFRPKADGGKHAPKRSLTHNLG